MSFIDTKLDNPLLNPERIALAHKMSLRALHYLFKGTGYSVSEYIWTRRLEQCHRQLQSSSNPGESLTNIAMGAGFNSLSHFSAMFRKQYGMSPTEFRFKKTLDM